MSDNEKLTPERAVRLLRAKGAELEAQVKAEWDMAMHVNTVAADIALVAQLLADHIERSEHLIALLEVLARSPREETQ